MDPDKLYPVPDAAGELGNVSVWAIYKWFAEGRLKRTKVGTRSMVKGSDMQAFIDSCNAKPAEPKSARPKRRIQNRRATPEHSE
jgi:hypothetical protein